MIRITKVGDDQFLADVKPVNPHSVEPTWESSRPMTGNELFRKLTEIGCHPVDIYDAFKVVDPSFDYSDT